MKPARSVTEIAPRASSKLKACAAFSTISYPGSGNSTAINRFASCS